MDKEDYVNLEVAQLLKNTTIFTNNFKYIVTEDIDKDNYGNSYKKGDICHYEIEYNNKIITLIAPSLWATQKWLRKEHNIHILIDVDYIHFDPEKYMITMCKIGEYKKAIFYTAFNSYEEAVNVSIKEALKYI